MRRHVVSPVLVLVVLATGCAEIQDIGIAARNRHAAYGAWKSARWDYLRQGVPHTVREHIGRGFQQGYFDVASGGSGETPLFPPQTYWGVRYQNPRGNELIAAWFRGYQDGAMAAEREGLATFNQIPSSTPGGPNATPGGMSREAAAGETIPMPPPESVPVPPIVEPTTIAPPNAREEVPLSTVDALPMLPSPAPSKSPSIPPAPLVEKAPPAPSNTATVPVPLPKTETTPMPPTPAGAAPSPAVPKPSPSGTRPRDPIGGKQTLFAPPEPAAPVAQESLFGETLR